MPYIRKEIRPTMDTVVDQMIKAGVQVDGDLNYILFKFCKNHVKPSYNNYKNFLGELNEAAEEIRRRLLAPYENLKIEENGDVD
jgi:hypothetical protein